MNNNISSEDSFEEILEKLDKYIYKIVNKYYIAGYEKEDLIQEARIGVYSAKKYFDKEKNDNFIKFACLCIERRIIMLLKKSKRQKNIPLNESLSLDKPILDDNDNSFIDIININDDDICKYLEKENLKDRKKELFEKLSEKEREVLELYISGFNISEIKEKMSLTYKSVDNTIQRIKKKAKNTKKG